MVSRGLIKVAVSSPDRTVVDGLNRPKVCGGLRLLVEMLDSFHRNRAFDQVRLAAVARKVASGAAWKRLGYLAEHLWEDGAFIVREAERNSTAGVAKLDPSGGSVGAIDRRWNLLINAHLDKPYES
jgi:predicted transcriptional regulator of viral defense system